MTSLARIGRAWSQFWFESDGRAQVAVFRVGFALLLLGCYAIRSLDLGLFYSDRGIMPLSILTEVAPMDYRLSLFRWWTSDAALWIGNSLYLMSLLAFAIGVRPRLTVILAWVLHLSFVHRNLSVAYGVDLIACFFYFYLSFADYRNDRAYRRGDLRATLGSMAYRLCQIQVCIIYGFSGMKKLKGYLWWNGEAIWNSLADAQLARWDFTWIAHYPLAMAAATYLTVAWELYFPALIWIRPIRKPLLVVGIFLHLGIAIGLALPFFGALMVLTYVFFLDRQDIDGVRNTLGGLRLKISNRIFVPRFLRIFGMRSQVPAPGSE